MDDVWKSREKASDYFDDIYVRTESQQFLQFLHKTSEIKSNKYVGVIHYKDKNINLLPKIFYDDEHDYTEAETQQIHNHILWWLSYCRKIKFPNYQTSLGNTKNNFFEVLIYLFSKYTRDLLGNSIYQQYEEINADLPYIKGRVNTQLYINQNIIHGNWHKLNCTFDAFVLDNQFNRIIKFVSTMLFRVTSGYENKKNLREILFILDDVSDVRVTAEECQSVQFNPIFNTFETVRDYCYLFLSNSISFDYKNELKLFAFLLPMEYVFEDFIFGFIDKEVGSVTAKAQVSSKYLDTEKSFQLRPDLLIQTGSKALIADTKYKIIYSDEANPKNGVSQADLYQMIAYAVRFNIDEIILFFPNTIMHQKDVQSEFIIQDMLANDREIVIKVFQLPILNNDLIFKPLDPRTDLRSMFELTRNNLRERIENIFRPIMQLD